MGKLKGLGRNKGLKKLASREKVSAIFAELNDLKRNHRESLRGHRDRLYALIACVARIKMRIDKNEKLRSSVIREVLKKRKEVGRAEPRSEQALDLSLELMAMATGARSRESRKVASNRAGLAHAYPVGSNAVGLAMSRSRCVFDRPFVDEPVRTASLLHELDTALISQNDLPTSRRADRRAGVRARGVDLLGTLACCYSALGRPQEVVD